MDLIFRDNYKKLQVGLQHTVKQEQNFFNGYDWLYFWKACCG